MRDRMPTPPKKQKRQVSTDATIIPSAHDDTASHASLSSEFSGLEAPSPWTKVDLSNCDEQTFACCQLNDDGSLDSFLVSKCVVFEFNVPEGSAARATVYIRGRRFKTQDVQTVKEAEDLLSEAGNMKLCPGSGLKPTSKSFASWNGSYFSARCSHFRNHMYSV